MISKRGFTLIELMVSVAIFTVVMVIALGSLLSVSGAERKAETLKSVMTNLNFALESMSRTIRTGSNYHCDTSNISSTLVPQDCPNASAGADYMVLEANDSSYVTYCLNANSIWRQRVNDAAQIRTSCLPADGFLQITAPEVIVNDLTFYVKGACSSAGSGGCTADAIQPKVLISLDGYINISSVASSTFSVQTSVTQRIYDQ
jgi:prepilin-type N-terminal cleavage/methylation domain-containing protein